MGGDEIANTPTSSFVDKTEELKKTIDCQVKNHRRLTTNSAESYNEDKATSVL